jgi:hypothetical protein
LKRLEHHGRTFELDFDASWWAFGVGNCACLTLITSFVSRTLHDQSVRQATEDLDTLENSKSHMK